MCWRYVWPGIRHIARRRLADFAPVLFFIILMGLLYSIMFSNVGLAYRQRAQLMPWFFMVAAVGRELRLNSKTIPVGARDSTERRQQLPASSR
jgi:hypothetical protein